ncbi:hypothetical protein BVRB_1g012680 isoform A [Beta vulgaris subsp. vulgaris]|uniref:F-box protein At1g49990 isoform X2 n=1 Tax=Beta vulgaris subsp. vulgaris TaxID=3555 RepID=UPI00053FC9B5|nr:F-box protein At1g49990 isoform X2 [Beta vulgaris subsp. vulgaris]KMT19422.1 hypothetical protein BVRB_1g012680 isoform A [Beta vulgaris subsp. vulgaris]
MDILPDEIVSEILRRLPVKSIHRSKSVSKRWYSIICNPQFVISYVSKSSSSPPSLHIIDRFILISPTDSVVSTQLELVSAPNVGTFTINPTLLLSSQEIPTYVSDFPNLLLQHHNGLLLFSMETKRDNKNQKTRTRFSHLFGDSYDKEDALLVCNVYSREWVRIPAPPHPLDQRQCVGFITRMDDHDLGVVSKFVVVEYQHLIPTNGAMLMCFSSDTGRWVVKEAEYLLGLQQWRADWAFTFRGRLFWVVVSIGIIVWDEDPFCSSENERKAVCRLIHLPLGCARPVCTVDLMSRRSVGVSGGFIQFIEMIMSGETVLELWRLSDLESGEWVLLHKVSQDYLVDYLYHHLTLTLPQICFLHPFQCDTVFFQTGAYAFSYNLRTGKVVSISKFIGDGQFLPIVLPTWPTSIPPRLYAAYAKEEGNGLFKGGNFDEAISSYSRSIALSASAQAYANRALAYLKVSRFSEAEDDCNHALSLDGDYVKVYKRRAIARKELGNLQGSMDDIGCVLKLEPNNQDMKKQYSEIKSLLEREQA